MDFTDRVKDITYQEIIPSIIDLVNNSNVFFSKILSNVKDWEGVTENQPVTIANSNTGGSFSGMDTFSTEATNNTRQLTWFVKGYEQSIVVPGVEKAVNSNREKQVLSLVSTRLDEARVSMAQSIGQLFQLNGNGKDFDGLGNIVDNGSVAASYGGLVRASTPGISADVTPVAANGAITLDLISAEHDNVRAASSQQESPTLGYSSKAIWTFIEGLLQPMIASVYMSTQINGYNQVNGKTPVGTSVPAGSPELKGAAGFNAITYRGVPLVADDNAVSGQFTWLNEHYLDFYRLVDHEDLEQVSANVEVTEGFYEDVPLPSFLQLRDFMSPVNQYGKIGFFVLLGNLICKQPRRNGKLTGITTN